MNFKRGLNLSSNLVILEVPAIHRLTAGTDCEVTPTTRGHSLPLINTFQAKTTILIAS
jgi:hypothetical protein